LRQAKRLRIPISNDPTPSKAELKDLVISRAKVDTYWIKGRSGYLRIHEFIPDSHLFSSHYISGGKFVVLLYESGSIELREIQTSDAGEWNLVRVARYEQQDDHEYPVPVSGLLTKTTHGCSIFAYINEARDKYVSWTKIAATTDCETVDSSFSSSIISHERLKKSKSWRSAAAVACMCGIY